jgi:hypothetical protein
LFFDFQFTEHPHREILQLGLSSLSHGRWQDSSDGRRCVE